MAQIESISKTGDMPANLHSQEKKSVARLLKENPYMGGVALVGLTSASQVALLPKMLTVLSLHRLVASSSATIKEWSLV